MQFMRGSASFFRITNKMSWESAENKTGVVYSTKVM